MSPAELPTPEDVAGALRSGVAPSTLVDGDPEQPPAGGSSVGDQGGTQGTPSDPERDPDRSPAQVSGGGVTVRTSGGTLLAARDSALAQLRADDVAARLAQKDATLWGPDAAVLAGTRLGWLDAVDKGRALLPQLTALRDALAAEGLDRVVLAGMGGSSLAPEVVCATYGAALVTLDSTDPGQVRSALAHGDAAALQRTVVVVSSKSGGTIETDSHRRAARAAFEAAGIDPAQRLVVVTDPGSPLAEAAEAEGVRALFLADPDVGGRYSALTAFGLVPSCLAGVDVARLLDDAEAVLPTLSDDAGPGLVLGALLGGSAVSGRDKLVLAATPGAPVGFGDWAEQLVAESTGKGGKGLLPVVVEGPDAPGTEPAADSHLLLLGAEPPEVGSAVDGPLGAQFLVWEYATAVAGRVLSIDPFDQPNVQESKDGTAAVLAGDAPQTTQPLFSEGGVEVHATGDLLAEVDTLSGALDALLHAVPERGYLALLVYLDRVAEARAAELRALLAARLAHPVTFGWAPRFLHSTGQFHKGGPQTGAFLQVTAAVQQDLEVPGKPYSFGVLQAAQAAGDLRALAGRERPVLRLHLVDRAAGLDHLLRVARGRDAA